jgi:hypothetical protein
MAWTRYLPEKLTLEQCEALFHTPKEFCSPFDGKIKAENFLYGK